MAYIAPVHTVAEHPEVYIAIAEPRRREILGLLTRGERSVGDMVGSLGLPQPRVSKHLRVLRDAGLVDVREAGRSRLYRLNGDRMKLVHDWVRTFEEFWDHKLARIKSRAESGASPPASARPKQQNPRSTQP